MGHQRGDEDGDIPLLQTNSKYRERITPSRASTNIWPDSEPSSPTKYTSVSIDNEEFAGPVDSLQVQDLSTLRRMKLYPMFPWSNFY